MDTPPLAPVRPPSRTTPSLVDLPVPTSNLQETNATLASRLLSTHWDCSQPKAPPASVSHRPAPPTVNAPPASVSHRPAPPNVVREELKTHVMKGHRVHCPKQGSGTVVKVFNDTSNDPRMPSVTRCEQIPASRWCRLLRVVADPRGHHRGRVHAMRTSVWVLSGLSLRCRGAGSWYTTTRRTSRASKSC
jgi:hypothetical protein